MKYEIKPDDEAGILRMIIHGALEKPDVDEMMPQVAKELDKMKRRLVLVDMSRDKNPSSMSREARKVYGEHAAVIKPEKVAMIGTNPVTRMISRIALTVTGRAKVTKFFPFEEETLVWLKGEKKK